ncbi:hypothetical protein BJY59DRAFT_697891 [Rhodotorula toruloides]
MPRRYDPSEPRRADLAQPWKYYSSESSLADLASMASMACSGLAMITRFPIWPWIGLLLAISGITGAKSLGTNKKTGESGGMLSGEFSQDTIFRLDGPGKGRVADARTCARMQAGARSCSPQLHSSPSTPPSSSFKPPKRRTKPGRSGSTRASSS